LQRCPHSLKAQIDSREVIATPVVLFLQVVMPQAVLYHVGRVAEYAAVDLNRSGADNARSCSCMARILGLSMKRVTNPQINFPPIFSTRQYVVTDTDKLYLFIPTKRTWLTIKSIQSDVNDIEPKKKI
jgi:hypothetical protein